MKQLVSIAALLTCLVSLAQEKTAGDISRFKLKSAELRTFAMWDDYGNLTPSWLKKRTDQPDSLNFNTAAFQQGFTYKDPGFGLGVQLAFIPRSQRLKANNRSHEFQVGAYMVFDRAFDIQYTRELLFTGEARREFITLSYGDGEIGGNIGYSYSQYFNTVRVYGGVRLRYAASIMESVSKTETAWVRTLDNNGNLVDIDFQRGDFTEFDARRSQYLRGGINLGVGFKIIPNLEAKFAYAYELGAAYVQGGPTDPMNNSHGVEASILWEFGKLRYKTIEVGEGYNQ